MFALFIFGTFLESRIGSINFLIIFFLAGIAGSLGYMLTASDQTIPAIGASGAVYGIIGALAIVTPFMMVWVMGMVPMPMIAVAFIWGIMEVFGLFSPGSIAHGAHIFGLIIGVLFGFYLRQQENKKIREKLKF
jgi:membrane associated rhomboid family serine protease